jgi:Rps23 Pro-64 3,4-dihydroxylase Tpa1-like proline 4-hydroxylase
MVNEFDKEKLKQEYLQGKPFNHVVIDNFFDDETAKKLSDEFPDYDNDKIWSIYRNPLENKRTNCYWDLFPSTTYQAFSYLNSNEFTKKIGDIIGVNGVISDMGLHGGGWHMTPNGGKLNIHKDYSIHPKLKKERLLNLIIYMTPEWNSDWGGGLELWSHDEEKNLPKECVTTLYNKFNRAVLFNTTQNSWHGLPEELKCPPNIYRKSLNIYYLGEPRENIETHQKAVFAPYKEQINDKSILELIKKRSNIQTFKDSYRT